MGVCEIQDLAILKENTTQTKVKELQKLEDKIEAPQGDLIQYFREFDPGSG